MNFFIIRILILIPLLGWFPVTQADSDLKLLEVRFVQSEPGLDSYTSRYLLGSDFLRLDDGIDEGDFIIFDLKTGVIHSFNHEDQTHLQIKPESKQEIKFELDFRVEKTELKDAPQIAGKSPIEYRFFADNKLCKLSVNVHDLLPEMNAAMKDYEQVLANQAGQTLHRIPAAARDACYMANYFVHATDYLDNGFPLHVVDNQQRELRLESYQQVVKPDTIRAFPQGYRVYHPSL